MSSKFLAFLLLPSIVSSFLSSSLVQKNCKVPHLVKISDSLYYTKKVTLSLKVEDKSDFESKSNEPSAFDRVASMGLAGVLAIACAESIFWALGMPLAEVWVFLTTGEFIDLMTPEGQLQAAGFTFGYGGFATVILQYRVTLFAIPLVPIMEKFVVEPGKKIFGEKFGVKENNHIQ